MEINILYIRNKLSNILVYIINKLSKLTTQAKIEYYRNQIESKISKILENSGRSCKPSRVLNVSLFILEKFIVIMGLYEVVKRYVMMNEYVSKFGNHLASSFDNAKKSNHDPYNYLSDVSNGFSFRFFLNLAWMIGNHNSRTELFSLYN